MFVVNNSVKSILGYGNDVLAYIYTMKVMRLQSYKLGFLNTITLHSYEKDMTEGFR